MLTNSVIIELIIFVLVIIVSAIIYNYPESKIIKRNKHISILILIIAVTILIAVVEFTYNGKISKYIISPLVVGTIVPLYLIRLIQKIDK